jgi:hypothetical protein
MENATGGTFTCAEHQNCHRWQFRSADQRNPITPMGAMGKGPDAVSVEAPSTVKGAVFYVS